jgi:hypothetical protein
MLMRNVGLLGCGVETLPDLGLVGMMYDLTAGQEVLDGFWTAQTSLILIISEVSAWAYLQIEFFGIGSVTAVIGNKGMTPSTNRGKSLAIGRRVIRLL